MASSTLSYRSGQPVAIKWSADLAGFSYYISPSASSRSWVDQRDPSITHVELVDYEQGSSYDLFVTGVLTADGQRVAKTYRFRVETAPALEVVEQWPEDDTVGVALTLSPSITFSEPVVDREAAERAITSDPPIRLAYTWPADNQVAVSPVGGWPFSTEVTVSINGGPGSIVGQGGGFLADTYQIRFLTRPNKIIDVDLTKQVVTLFEGDELVYTCLTATGVRGAETPTGEFTVLYKLASTRMRGQNPSGTRYDIPNVPWVLAFWGDYTIHGAPWRQAFGIPQSNGCVSLTTSDAKLVYDWAPVGTLIRIHY